MTMVDSGARLDAVGADASWHMVEEGFWVGNVRGMFLGTIEHHDPNRFFAREATRAYVGEYRSLSAAKAAVMAHFG